MIDEVIRNISSMEDELAALALLIRDSERREGANWSLLSNCLENDCRNYLASLHGEPSLMEKIRTANDSLRCFGNERAERVEELEGEVSDLKSEVKDLEREIEEMKSKIDQLEEELSKVHEE